MALMLLLSGSAAITAGLTRMRQAAPRWLVIATLASLGVFVQAPVRSRLLNLRPLPGIDWALVAAAFAVVAGVTYALALRLRRHTN